MKNALFLFVLLSLSCQKEPEILINIRPQYKISLLETWDNSQKFKVLKIETIETFGCTDDTVAVTYRLENQVLTIYIGDKPKNNPCEFGRAPLINKIRLPDFEYVLAIEIIIPGEIHSKGFISNQENFYQLTIEEHKGIEVKFHETQKIEQQLIWGYAYPKSYDLANKQLAYNFTYNIEENSIIKRLNPGFYSYFKITQDRKFVWEDNLDIFGEVINFYYFHQLDDIKLEEYLGFLQQNFNNIIGFKVQTGSGKNIESK